MVICANYRRVSGWESDRKEQEMYAGVAGRGVFVSEAACRGTLGGGSALQLAASSD